MLAQVGQRGLLTSGDVARLRRAEPLIKASLILAVQMLRDPVTQYSS
jgi:hypothetical protein